MMHFLCKVALAVLIWVPQVLTAASLTADQLRMVEQLSAQDKAKLAQQYGVSVPHGSSKVKVASPQTVKPRAMGTSVIENSSGSSADAKLSETAIGQSAQAKAPIEKVSGQSGSDKVEVKRAFADFVRESKPLQVNTANLKQFGYDLFAGVPSTFAPATDIPVPAEYVLGPGDELEIQLYGQRSESFTLVVDREGSVAFPDIGPLTLAGMSFAEAKAFLAQQVGDKMVGVSASIGMGKLRSIRIFALGEVERPGSYTVSGLATLSHALFASGGIKKIGSLRHVQLKRQGKVVVTLDLYDFLLKGDTRNDVRLLPGDVVFVPPIGQTVSIAGQVVRPAIYEIRGQLDVADLIKLAGGLLPKAYRDQALLERVNSQGSKSVQSFALKGKGLKTRVHNGDVVKIFSSLDFEENPVLLIGNVKRPGKYAWKTGMVLKDILPDESMLLPETYMDYGLIEREAEGNREPELIRFDVAKLFDTSAEKIQLKPRDKVFIFHRSHFRVAPKVEVVGSVKSPGEYALKKNMRILDLILAAGGTTRETSFESAELYRTDAETKKVKMIRFNVGSALRGEPESNLLIQDLDRIVIHSIWEKEHRKFVTIQGEVKKPNQYPLGEGMKVSDLIFAAGGLTRDVLLEDIQIYRMDDQSKEITLITVNLPKLLDGEADHDIKLQDLDRVVVHSIWERKVRFNVKVSGEVKKPGVYNYADTGMRIADLIFAAGGLTEKALVGKAEVTRYKVVDGQARESFHFDVDLAAALKGDEKANILLQPYDVVTIRQLSNWRAAEHVVLSGEFKFNGSYPIEDGEKLSDLIKRSGGFTDKAYLKAAVFTRESIRKEQQKQLDEMVGRMEADIAQEEQSITSLSDAQLIKHKQSALLAAKRVLGQMKQVKASGRLVLQLEDIKRLETSEFNLTLRDGDKLHVPKKPDEVMVMGEVYNTTALLYRNKYDLEDYVDAAGGMTRLADESRIYVVRANGMVERASSWGGTDIEPGDVIVVPQELEQFNLLNSTLDWSRVLMQVGVGLASMKTIGVF